MKTFNGVGVIVGLWRSPRAGDRGRTLRSTVEAMNSLRLCRMKTSESGDAALHRNRVRSSFSSSQKIRQ